MNRYDRPKPANNCEAKNQSKPSLGPFSDKIFVDWMLIGKYPDIVTKTQRPGLF
jgi:hypothetical protein